MPGAMDPTSFDTNNSSVSSSSSTSSSSKFSSANLKDTGLDHGTPLTSPEMAELSEPKTLLSMYTNIEIGAVASLDRRDQQLVKLAEIKQVIAKVERKLARWRGKEYLALHRLQVIRRDLADKRILQADVNLERAKYYQQRLADNPRLSGVPSNIVTTLGRPSMMCLSDEIACV